MRVRDLMAALWCLQGDDIVTIDLSDDRDFTNSYEPVINTSVPGFVGLEKGERIHD